MENEPLFSERQHFRQWWLWIFLLGTNVLTFYGIIKQVIGGQPYGDKPLSNNGLIVTSVFVMALLFFSAYFVLKHELKRMVFTFVFSLFIFNSGIIPGV